MIQLLVFRWRHVLVLKDLFILHSKGGGAAAASTLLSSSYSSFYSVLFHSNSNSNSNSTPFSSSDNKCVKNNNSRCHIDEGPRQQPFKNHIRFACKKCADTKRALKGLLFSNGSQAYFPNIHGRNGWDDYNTDHSENINNRNRPRSSSRHASKAQYKKMKRKLRQKKDSNDERPETVFQATYGNNSYTWFFKLTKEPDFQSSTTGFEWREHSNLSDDRKSQNPSDIESDDETCFIDSSSDRNMLGLPAEGALNIEDVKNAFRLSALKWHPDKHQGPSQLRKTFLLTDCKRDKEGCKHCRLFVETTSSSGRLTCDSVFHEIAEEKFKLCVNAYKSLCGALSST